jgi:hypothetical protein
MSTYCIPWRGALHGGGGWRCDRLPWVSNTTIAMHAAVAECLLMAELIWLVIICYPKKLKFKKPVFKAKIWLVQTFLVF